MDHGWSQMDHGRAPAPPAVGEAWFNLYQKLGTTASKALFLAEAMFVGGAVMDGASLDETSSGLALLEYAGTCVGTVCFLVSRRKSSGK